MGISHKQRNKRKRKAAYHKRRKERIKEIIASKGKKK